MSADHATSPADEIAATVDDAYEVLAFEPGSEPRWDRFRALFTDQALLALRVFPHDRAIRVLTMDAYVCAQLENGMKEEGYAETPGKRMIEIIGDIAQVRQAFTMNFADRDVEAVDLFTLARLDDRWRIISVASDVLE